MTAPKQVLMDDDSGKVRLKIPGLRWWVIALVFLAAVLNYVDRQTLSALAPTIQHDLKMNDEAYADLVPWLWLYRLPRQSKWIRQEELRLIEAPASDELSQPVFVSETPWSWGRVLTCRATWLLLFGRLITDPAWYFYQFWFPK